jgi:hypothetical protein
MAFKISLSCLLLIVLSIYLLFNNLLRFSRTSFVLLLVYDHNEGLADA